MARLARVVIHGYPHHITQRGNGRARARFPDFAELLASEEEADLFASLRAAESIGRPLECDRILARVEKRTGRAIKAGKRGPKPSAPENS
jgi:putative transposase